MMQNAGVLHILTCKCAWSHSGVPFFNNCSTSARQKVLLATAACNFSTSQLQKVVRTCSERRIFIENVLLATAACNFSTSQLQKVVRECCVLYILTCKCASRHSGVQFFHIATSKSGPRMLCFVHFDLQMCFSLQRRAIFHFRAERPPPHPPL